MALWGKRSGSLVTCRGRRRIGKSTLIEVFAHKAKARFIRIEGVRPKQGYSNNTELNAFAKELAAQTRAEDSMPENWLKAFMRLDREINEGERTVVLLDEVSWLGHYDEEHFARDILHKAFHELYQPVCVEHAVEYQPRLLPPLQVS